MPYVQVLIPPFFFFYSFLTPFMFGHSLDSSLAILISLLILLSSNLCIFFIYRNQGMSIFNKRRNSLQTFCFPLFPTFFIPLFLFIVTIYCRPISAITHCRILAFHFSSSCFLLFSLLNVSSFCVYFPYPNAVHL